LGLAGITAKRQHLADCPNQFGVARSTKEAVAGNVRDVAIGHTEWAGVDRDRVYPLRLGGSTGTDNNTVGKQRIAVEHDWVVHRPGNDVVGTQQVLAGLPTEVHVQDVFTIGGTV
jgi:hypothetical protein